MKNKYIFTIILILSIIFLVVFIKTGLRKDIAKSEIPKEVVINKEGGVLIGAKAYYENLSDQEKTIVSGYYNKIMLGRDGYRESEPISSCLLKYYDQNIALIGCAGPKPALPLSFYDLNKSLPISFPTESVNYYAPINLFAGYIENQKYLISIYDDFIVYYIPGEKEFKILDSSKILNKNETYLKEGGMTNDYEASFFENTNVLKVSVFKKENNQGKPNQKVREIEFTL